MNIDNKNEDTSKNVEQYLYEKEVICPVCGNKFMVSVVKSTAYRIRRKDSDLYIDYALVNPYFYDVWLCNECGYSALKSDFTKIKKHQIQLIKDQLSPKWNKRQYPKEYDVKIAIERYKLSLLSSSIIESKFSVKAMTCLKIAWMYRLLEDPKNEQLFLADSLKQFNESYFKEDFPIYGMDRFSTMYLIGELNRRTGNYKEALLQFSNVITNPGASRKIKDLAIAQKDIARAAAEEKEIEEEEAKAAENQDFDEIEDDSRKKRGLFSRLFG